MTSVPDPLDAAVQRMLAGDEDGMREVYRSVQPPLLRYLTVLVGPDHAEDVASEAWAEAFGRLDRFEGAGDGFRGWLTTIARHRAIDLLRRQRRQPVSQVIEEALDIPAPTDVEAAVLGAIGSQDAMALIASLPPDQAEAIMLRTVLGFDAPAAARILGKRPGAVRGASHRGLKALAKRLDAEQRREFRRPRKLFGAGRNTSGPFDAEAVT